MAIATINGKLAIMEFGQVWEPGLPLSPGTLGKNDKQQLLWGYPDVAWHVGGAVAAALWCALTGMSGKTGGGDILEMGG